MQKRCHNLWTRFSAAAAAVCLFTSGLLPVPAVWAQTQLSLPLPGTRVHLSSGYAPLTLRGVMVHADNPFRFDFIVDTGDSELRSEALEQESTRMIRYFLAALTVPEDEQWVNLSPYEQQRIIPGSFGITDMGRDLLAQDYILKQVTASLIYPEEDLGKEFWDRVYSRAQRMYGTTDIPVNTFNKVWIVPDSATVFENGTAAFVTQSRLKIMLEEDYLALDSNEGNRSIGLDQFVKDEAKEVNDVSAAIVREIVIPELEKEVNEGKNFARLRQIYHAMILATWFKENLKTHVLGLKYVNQNKVAGVDIDDTDAKERIYQRYLQAYRDGAYNYIKEEYDPVTKEIIPRKYFSGGAMFGRAVNRTTDYARLTNQNLRTVVDGSFLGDKLALNVLLADPQRRVNRDRAVLQNLPVFVNRDDLEAAVVDTDTESARYPILTLLNGNRVINKTRQNRNVSDRIYEALMSRANFEVARLIGFDGITPVQVLVTPQGVSSIEQAWGVGLADILQDLGLESLRFRDALDFRIDGQAGIYGQLADTFGPGFVAGDLYRIFTNDPFDSILAENIRASSVRAEDQIDLRWVDYGDSFSYLTEGELDDLLDYLVERADFIRASLGDRMVERIVSISQDEVQAIAENVFGGQTEGFFSELEAGARELVTAARERARNDFMEGFQQRQGVFREFQQYLNREGPAVVDVVANAGARDAAVLSDTRVTDTAGVRRGMEELTQLLERLPQEIAAEVAGDLNMIKVYSGVSPEVGFTQSEFQFILGRLDSVARTVLIEAIRADEDYAVIQHREGRYSIVNVRAALEVIAANADLFPAEAQGSREWIVNEFAQWTNVAGPEWETRTIRYGLLSGYPRSAAEQYIEFDRTLKRFKDIFTAQEDQIEFFAKRELPENQRQAAREHFQSVLIGYDVSDEEIDLIIDSSVVGRNYTMIAMRPEHRRWVAEAEALLAEGERYLGEIRPQFSAEELPTGTEAGGQRDAAVLPESEAPVGGIDLSPEYLQLLREGSRVEIDLTPVGIENIDIRGLTPVIFQITPVTNLPLLLSQAGLTLEPAV